MKQTMTQNVRVPGSVLRAAPAARSLRIADGGMLR